MALLFFNHNEEEPTINQEEKLNELLSLLQTYNLIPHDNHVGRSKSLHVILEHLDTMILTPSLFDWIKQDLIDHLNYYDVTVDLTSAKPSINL